MEIADATELIRTKSIQEERPQRWADLGCGIGTFTLSLATLLAPGSMIHALDKDEGFLAQIPPRYRDVAIHKQAIDLLRDDVALPQVDGVLIANLLHFIEAQEAFIERVRAASAKLLIVEYEGRGPNQWVPFPLPYPSLQNMLSRRGYKTTVKLGTRASRFGGYLYSACAE